MARAHFVKKARAPNAERKAAGIKKGDSYYWWAFMVGGRGGRKHYSKTAPKASQLTQSDFLSQFYALEERIAALTADDGLATEVESIASDFRDLGSEQEDKKNNMPEGLQDGDTGQMLEERASKCNEIADELDNIDMSDPPDDDPRGKDESSAQSDDENADDYWAGKLEEVLGVDTSAP